MSSVLITLSRSVQCVITCYKRLTENGQIPQRVILCIFAFVGLINIYTLRLVLEACFGEITKQSNQETQYLNRASIPQRDFKSSLSTTSILNISLSNSTKSEVLKILKHLKRTKTFQAINNQHWTQRFARDSCPLKEPETVCIINEWSSQHVQNLVLMSFYVGYSITHVPGAIWSERYGGKWVLGISVAATALFTLVTPLTIKIGGPAALIFLRLCIGLSEGPALPALAALLSKWVPARERGKLGVFVLSGGQVGSFLTNLIAALILPYFEWDILFYFFGICALIWFICYIRICFSDPESNPYITDAEKQYLQKEIGISKSRNDLLAPTPWHDILTNIPVWAFISATTQHDWTEIQSHLKLPNKVFKEDQKCSLSDSMYSSINIAMPYFLNWIMSLVSGCLSDFLVNRNVFTTTAMRKIMTSITAIAPNVLLSLTSRLSCDEQVSGAISFLNCAIGVLGPNYAGITLSSLDLSPNFAATLMGIANGFGALTGLIAPFLASIVPRRAAADIKAIVWVACTILTSGEVQPFNEPGSDISFVMSKIS